MLFDDKIQNSLAKQPAPVVLERIREYLQYRIDRRNLETMRLRAVDLYNDIAITIENEMLGERIKKEVPVHFECRYPATWWEHFKQENFPAWLLRRYPVKFHVVRECKTVELERHFVFPDAYERYEPQLGRFVVRDLIQIRRS